MAAAAGFTRVEEEGSQGGECLRKNKGEKVGKRKETSGKVLGALGRPNRPGGRPWRSDGRRFEWRAIKRVLSRLKLGN